MSDLLTDEQTLELLAFAKKKIEKIAEMSVKEDESLSEHETRLTEDDSKWLQGKTEALIVAMLEKIGGIEEVEEGVFAAKKELVHEMMEIIHFTTLQVIEERMFQLEWQGTISILIA